MSLNSFTFKVQRTVMCLSISESLELLFDCRSFSKQLWVSVQVQNRV